MWSLGILLYTLLAGFLPFQGKDAEEVADNIKAGNYNFDHPEFNSTKVSDECKDLIKNLLKVDPYSRFSANDAVNHPCFKKYTRQRCMAVEKIGETSVIVKKLRTFRDVSRLKRALLNLLVKMATDEEVSAEAELF